MVNRTLTGAVGAILLLACSRGGPSPSPSAATSASPPPSDAAIGTLTPERRQRLIDRMTPIIRARYVSSELAAATAQALEEHLARGDYASLSVEGDFAHRLTDDVRAVTHDLHFRVRYKAPGTTDVVTDKDRAELEVEARHGIHSVERLPNGVAILKLDSFLEPPDSQALRNAYASVMGEIADARALVLDLRDNYGGDPTTVAFALSYFFDATPVHLGDVWSREEDVTWQNWTRRDVPGPRFGAYKPIFVLVSKETISGGEAAAYDLQSQKRAIVIGETTAGAANLAPPFDLGDGFAVYVPVARAINAITHTNWEGTGVRPDIAVNPSDAQKVALSMAADAG